MCDIQGDAQGKIFHAMPISNRTQAMHAGSTTFMRLSSQNETLINRKECWMEKSAQKKKTEKLLQQILQEKKKQKPQFKQKCNGQRSCQPKDKKYYDEQ